MLGLQPMPVPPHVFAVGSEQLRYGRFERAEGATDAGLEFAEYHSVELPSDCFIHGLVGGPVREISVLQQAVVQLLEQVSGPITDASLVMPDSWLRVVFTEMGELPSRRSGQDEIVRWKLKRMVPYRIDELRTSHTEVRPLPNQEEPTRMLVGLGVEALMHQLEESFEDRGVHLGVIANASLSLLSGVSPAIAEDDLWVLARSDGKAYTLVFVYRDEPVLFRHKALNGEVPESALASIVRSDLNLTRTFLTDQFPDSELRRVVLFAPDESTDRWTDWLSSGLEAPVVTGQEILPLDPGIPPDEWLHVVPMYGAACREIG